MSDRTTATAVLEQFIEAIAGASADGLPLSENAEFIGAMLPEPLRGKGEVIRHLNEIAPFIKSMRRLESLVSGSAAAVASEFTGINGVRFQGSYFLNIDNGTINRIRAVVDTHPLFTGRSG